MNAEKKRSPKKKDEREIEGDCNRFATMEVEPK